MKKLLAGMLALALLATPALAQVNAPIPKAAPALTNTAVVLKPAAGVLQWVNCGNANAAIEYVQVFDVAGTVTVGTTPNTLALAIPPSTAVSLLLPAQTFNGIQVAATTTPGGSTAPGAALVCNFGIN